MEPPCREIVLAALLSLAALDVRAQVEERPVPAHSLHLRQAEIHDPRGFEESMRAATLLIPADWSFEGEISWNPHSGCMRGPLWNWSARSPDGRAKLFRTQGVSTSTSNSALHRPAPLAPVGGAPSARELLGFTVAHTMPWVRIAAIEQDPAIAREIADNGFTLPDGMGGVTELRMDHVVATLEDEVDGEPLRALVLLVSSHFRVASVMPGAGTLEQTGAATELLVGFSAPARDYDEHLRTFLLALSSTRIDPRYEARLARLGKDKLDKARRDGQALHAATMAGIAAIGKAGTAAWEARDAAAEKRTEEFVDLIREEATVQTSQGPAKVPQKPGQVWWELPDGTLKDFPEGFDPNTVGITASRVG